MQLSRNTTLQDHSLPIPFPPAFFSFDLFHICYVVFYIIIFIFFYPHSLLPYFDIDLLHAPKKWRWSDVSQMLSGQGVDPASFLRRGERQAMAMKWNFNTLPFIVFTNK